MGELLWSRVGVRRARRGVAVLVLVVGVCLSPLAAHASAADGARNRSGAAAPRPDASVATAPSAPTIGVARPSNGAAIVTWTAPSSQGSSPITGYRVTAYYDLIFQTTITFPSTATSQVFTSLVNGNEYRFKVAAINASGTSPNSGYSNYVTPREMYPPGIPAIGTAIGGDQQATVNWSTPASDGGAPITGYQVTTMVGGEGVAIQTFESPATTQVVTGLTNGVLYQFRVAAVNDAGAGFVSEPSNTVIPGALPGAPTSVVAFASNTQATVTWLAPASDGGTPITGYVVTPYIGATAQAPRTFGTTANSQVITGLTNGTSYTFRVAAINSTGTGPASDPSNAVVPAVNSVPGAPTIGSVTPGDRQVTVTWTAPTDTGGLSLTGYAITPYVGSVPQGLRTYPSTATSQVVTGLTNGTQYTFKVAAINVLGVGAYSSSSAAVAPAGVPTAPTIVSGVPGNGQVTLTWTAPTSNGGMPITAYVVTPMLGSVTLPAVTFNSSALSQTLTGLINGAPYRFSVAARNQIGLGASSALTDVIRPASSGTISGTVRDAGNQPVKGVVVEVAGYPSATTDATGAYSVPGVALGAQTVQAEGVCRAPVSQAVTVSGDTVVDLSVGGFVSACSVDAQVWDATTTALPLTTADTATAVALPFPVSRGGAMRSTAYVSTNGVVNFLGLETSSDNTAIPNAAAPNDAIYGFWDHLQIDSGSMVLADSFGTAPNRRFVIEYRNVTIYDAPSLRFSFQIVLYEDPTQRIRLQYKGNTPDSLSAGTSATVGHENAAGTGGQQVSFNKGLLFDGLSVRPK